MNIIIQIQYKTQWGESLRVKVGKRRFRMDYNFGGIWQTDLTGRELKDGAHYGFEVVRGDEVIRREWRDHTFKAPAAGKSVVLRDRWHEMPGNSAFWSSAFSDVIFRRPDGASFRCPRAEAPGKGNVTIRVAVPEVRTNQCLAIVGSGKVLGNWKTPLKLSDAAFPWWEITLDLQEAVEYKFVVLDSATGKIDLWEEGPNHFFAEVPPSGAHLVIADLVPRFPFKAWKGAGVAVPVFALKTKDSFGVGEFNDIKKLVDWAVITGQNIIQLLPINDTTMTHTWQDSYPYNAVSSFALHPQFIHLPDAGVRNDAHYRALKAELEDLKQIDYEKVNSAKLELLRKVYDTKGESIMQTQEYHDFISANAEWLMPYAAFSVLRDINGTPDFSTWGEFATYRARKVDEFIAGHIDDVNFYCFLQFLLDKQLHEVVHYAHLKGVALKGDLPIGVSRCSVDAWQNPHLFHMDSQAGAPPDAFSADGQNWGFPTYNWERMEEDGFAWWKARMGKMAEYFDAFRIDHILGFFRIWEIPSQYKSGLMGHFSPALPYSEDELRRAGFDPHAGSDTDVLFVEDPRRQGYWHPRISAQYTSAYNNLADWQKSRFNELYNDFFYHRHNDFWRDSAMKKLPALLRSTGMLSCGEDLGMIPACVPDVMASQNILSLEIQRMPKDPKDDFADPAKYPYWCVCATGTHDTAPLRAWWEEDRALTEKFYHQQLGGEGDAPYFCEPWIADQIIAQHLYCPAMLCILPLQDWLACDGDLRYQGNPADERINVPAIPRFYWRYRMHLSIEQLIEAKDFNAHIKQMIENSGRGE